LLPRLQSGAIGGSQEWIYLDPIVPGVHPLESLAVSLSQQPSLGDVVALHRALTSDALRTLHLLVSQLSGSSDGRKVVLLVDQCEEVFTLTAEEEERQHFFDLLVTAASEPRGSLLVLLALRADFYEHPMRYPPFFRLLEAQYLTILPMEREDLRRVIEGPANLPDVRVRFEENLVGDLLFEMREQIGALPLLEFTLDQLFARRSGRQLTRQAYHEIGGVKGALNRHAEATYAALPTETHRVLTRMLFLRLIDPGMTEQDTTRRRAVMSEFELPDATQTGILRESIDAFIAARLLTANEHTGSTTLEVSHEALIRAWPRLEGWLREARNDIRLQHTISEDAAVWEQNKRPGERLYRGTQLKEAQAWARRNPTSKQEHAFLRASAARQVRSLIMMLVVFLVIVTTSGVAGWFALHQPPKPGYVTTTDEYATGSLRWAIGSARAGDTITFDPSLAGKTITLRNTDLHIVQQHLTIQGLATGRITIQGIKAGIVVDSTASVTIIGLTFRGIKMNPFPLTLNFLITNQGKLILNNCVVTGNGAGTSNGGASIIVEA
jgi:hypothetical protein